MAGLQNLKSPFSQLIDEQSSTGVNYIEDVHAKGFTINTDSTDFLGVEGSTYTNPSSLGYENNVIDSIVNTEAVGFVPGIQPGDDTLFVGVTGTEYSNPGINRGLFYIDDYNSGPSPNFINFTKNRQEKDPTEYNGVDGDVFQHPNPDDQSQEESNQWLDIYDHKFTPNRKHLDPTEFKGASGVNYTNPGEFVGLHYYESYDDAGLGADYIQNIHATGFTKLRQHKDTSEFSMIGDNTINESNDNSLNGTLFRQFGNSVFTFGGEQKNKYLVSPGNTFVEKNRIDEDDVALIQQGGVRSNLIQGSEVKNIALEDVYKKHIDDLIDWENVKGKTDGRLDMRYDNGRFSANGYLPLAFSRNGITHEPYVVTAIPEKQSDLLTQNPLNQSLKDLERLGKYILSPDGVKFIAAQNAIGLLAYKYHRDTESGGTGRYRQSDIDAVGRQQFQYTYNPLSMFSSTVPYIKVRLNRSFLLDEDKYTERDVDLTGNENQPIKGIKNKTDEFDLLIEGDDAVKTTLGGSITKNVNTSIDGTTVNNQGRPGDYHTLAPIDVEEEVLNQKNGNKENLTTIEEGYPFYFKDMRNDKILMFRGYIKDLSENIAPSYSPEQYIGRSEPVISYSSTTRTINFSLDLYANNELEFKSIYQKLDYLTGLCYPEYFNDSSTEGYTLTRPKPPLCRMRLGELFGGGKTAQGDNAALKHGLLGYLNTLSYTFNEEGTWNNFDEESRAPKYITATIGFTVIHDQTPNVNTRFYGVNYEKVGV